MQKLFTTLLFCLVFAVVSVAAQTDHCFQNDGLKVRQTVSLTITKNKIDGTFESGGYDENTSAETFDFTGTKTGNLLRITFEGKPPYQLPPGTKKIIWTLGAKTLKIPTYGKNYNTKKYSTYTASYDKCKNNQWIEVKREEVFSSIKLATPEELSSGDIVYYDISYWAIVDGKRDDNIIVRETGFPAKDEIVDVSKLQILR